MAFGLVLPLRIVQVVLSLVVLGLSGYVANWYNVDTLTSSPTQINFLIFAGLWSIVSVGYLELVTKFFPRASHPWAALAFEVSNTLFFFAGFIALGHFLSILLFCRGTVCAAAQADTAFAAFLFCTWGVTVFLAARDVFKTGFPRRSATAGNAAAQSVAMKETMA
ncbi:membrane-associating domain-containing protein [Coniochaeta sp. 2T2.1]|nr:membrane-associating domain-containing protein [Coniochaeta sp. 2T2.1]